MTRGKGNPSKPGNKSLLSFSYSIPEESRSSLTKQVSRLFFFKKYTSSASEYSYVINRHDLVKCLRSYFNDPGYAIKYIYDDLLVVPSAVTVIAVLNAQGEVVFKLPQAGGINFDIYLDKRLHDIWLQIFDNLDNDDWKWAYNRYLGEAIMAYEESPKPIRVVIKPGKPIAPEEKREYYLVDLELGNVVGPRDRPGGYPTLEEAQAAVNLSSRPYEIIEVRNLSEAFNRVSFKHEYPF